MERTLDVLEREWWLMGRVNPAATTGVIVVHLEGPLSDVDLRKGLDALQAGHSQLAVRIPDAWPPTFAGGGVGPIPLASMSRRGDDHWRDATEAELNRAFPCAEGPLVRATHLDGGERHDLIFSFHHSISDGHSSVRCVGQLLSLVAAFRRGERPAVTARSGRPAIEHLLPAESKGWAGWRNALAFTRTMIGHAIRTQPRMLPVEKVMPPGGRTTRLIHRTLSEAETRSFSARCAARGVTEHAALCAAALGAIRSELDDPQSGVACLAPVDLRGLLDADVSGEIGNLISTLTTFHAGPGDGWTLARDVTRQTLRALLRQEPVAELRLHGLAVVLTRHPAVLSRLADRLSPAAVIVSSLHRPDVPTRLDRLRITGLQAAHAVVMPWVQIVAVTFDDRLALNFQYAEPTLSAARVTRVAEATIDRLVHDPEEDREAVPQPQTSAAQDQIRP
jgi:hypothetical protein